MNKILFSLLLIAGLSQAFDKEVFLKDCHLQEFYFQTFYIEELDNCLVCKNASITSGDFEEFKTNEFHITDAECVIFYGGDVGVVNSHFFKQFPDTKKINFESVSLSLESSENLVDNKNIELLGVLSSKIRRNHHSNALHSLPNLKKFVMTDCQLENQTFDKVLLQKNSKLEDVTILDSVMHPPKNKDLPILHSIDEDAFTNLDVLNRVYITIHNMTVAPSRLLKDRSKLKYVSLNGRFDKFPEDLPDQIIDLTVLYHNFDRVSRDNLKKFKDLDAFTMYYSQLAVIDEDAFDDLLKLNYLGISSNHLTSFTPRHLKNNHKIGIVHLTNNPIEGEIDLSELGLKEVDDKRYVKEKNLNL